jgi:hypothetical protein
MPLNFPKLYKSLSKSAQIVQKIHDHVHLRNKSTNISKNLVLNFSRFTLSTLL